MKQILIGLKHFLAVLWAGCAFLPALSEAITPEPSAAGDVVHVPAPTGIQETDRAGILGALDSIEPGGTVLFAAGVYVIGELVPVSVPGVTLLGHSKGTTIRGCAPEELVDMDTALFACNGLELRGARQTVRNITFEYAWHGLFVGCCFPEDLAAAEAGGSEQRDQPGGHIIEGNTFRYSSNGLRVVGESKAPVVIRGNVFRDTFHAIVVNGGTAHVMNNDVSAPDPGRVPIAGHPGGAILIAPVPPARSCGSNVIAGNRIEGHTDGISVMLFAPDMLCRGNVIRNNTILSHPVRLGQRPEDTRSGSPEAEASDRTLSGVPIALANIAPDSRETPRRAGDFVLGGIVVEGNRIEGGSGLGIEVLRSSGNRIVGNTISAISRRDPFPGNTVNSTDPRAAGWRAANGSGIWISAGSEQNEIADNIFENLAGAPVFVDDDTRRGAGR